MKPKDTIPEWPKTNAAARVDACRTMLALHGFLSDTENERVAKRIDKWAAKGGVFREPREAPSEEVKS